VLERKRQDVGAASMAAAFLLDNLTSGIQLRASWETGLGGCSKPACLIVFVRG